MDCLLGASRGGQPWVQCLQFCLMLERDDAWCIFPLILWPHLHPVWWYRVSAPSDSLLLNLLKLFLLMALLICQHRSAQPLLIKPRTCHSCQHMCYHLFSCPSSCPEQLFCLYSLGHLPLPCLSASAERGDNLSVWGWAVIYISPRLKPTIPGFSAGAQRPHLFLHQSLLRALLGGEIRMLADVDLEGTWSISVFHLFPSSASSSLTPISFMSSLTTPIYLVSRSLCLAVPSSSSFTVLPLDTSKPSLPGLSGFTSM